VQFGRPIERIPAVADLLAEMKLAIASGRALLYEAALAADYEYLLQDAKERAEDRDQRTALNKEQKRYKRLAGFLTPVAKYWLSEMCNRVAYEAVTSGTAERRFAEFAEADPPRGFKGRARQLEGIRRKLADAVDYLKREQSADYLDLMARPLVDVAIDVYLGYLWLGMVRQSKERGIPAKRFIDRAVPRCEERLRVIASGDRSTLDAFDVLVGPTFEES